VVLSIVRQFLHQVAQKSMSTGFCSRAAVSRPLASDGVQPSSICCCTVAATSVGSTKRFAKRPYAS